MKEHDNDDEKNILEMNYEQSENKIKNLKDDLSFWEDKLDKNAKKALTGNVNNVLGKVIRNVKYENLNSDNKEKNRKALNMYLRNKKIDKKDFLIALQNKDENSPRVSLRKKLRLYMLLVSKNDRKFLDMYRLMKNYNFYVEAYILDNAIYTGQSEVRNFTHYDQYIEFFKGLPDSETIVRNLLLIPNFIIFWNMDLELKKNKFDVDYEKDLTYNMCCEMSAERYNKKIDDLFDQIKFNNDIQNNKEKYKQTIKNMHLIYVKSMNSSYEDNPNRCLATELKDQNGNLIDVSQTFSDFADMLFAETLIDANTRDRLKSGPNSFLLHLSTIWKYIKFFFRKNILCQENIYYGYDSEILIKKIDHFGNIFAPGWFNADSYRWAKKAWKLKHEAGTNDGDEYIKDPTPDSVYFSAYMYRENCYFGSLDDTPVLNQMLINQALEKPRDEESPNFKGKEVKKENNVEEKEPEKEKKETIIVNNKESKE